MGPGVIEGACACGAVRVRMAQARADVTRCDCSSCHPHGAVWTHCDPAHVAVSGETDTWSRGARSIAFHRCRVCGCVTQRAPLTRIEPRMGVNARLRRLDGLVTERYLDA